MRLLLKAGADAKVKDVRGMTPLMLAVATDHPNLEIIRTLLPGSDTGAKSKAGETALDWALKFRNPAVLAALGTASQGAGAPNSNRPPRSDGTSTVEPALAKSVALLQKAGETNFIEGGCISCHAGNMVTAAVARAGQKGVRIDEAAASQTVRITQLEFAAVADGLLERSDPPAVQILSFALFALAEEGAQPDRTIDAMVHNLAAQQLADGSWPHFGILRPPAEDGIFSDTAMAIRVFKAFAPPARKDEFDERIARAVHALISAEPATTEDAVMRLLGVTWAGGNPAIQKRLQRDLIALQRTDGGWAQTPYLSPDAYATGSSLHALHESGIAANDPAYRKGVAFLLTTQAADGSWHVVSRAPKFQPYFQGGFPYEHDQWISQWGTGWASIALAHALPTKPQR